MRSGLSNLETNVRIGPATVPRVHCNDLSNMFQRHRRRLHRLVNRRDEGTGEAFVSIARLEGRLSQSLGR
jgi:hypothetical protein